MTQSIDYYPDTRSATPEATTPLEHHTVRPEEQTVIPDAASLQESLNALDSAINTGRETTPRQDLEESIKQYYDLSIRGTLADPQAGMLKYDIAEAGMRVIAQIADPVTRQHLELVADNPELVDAATIDKILAAGEAFDITRNTTLGTALIDTFERVSDRSERGFLYEAMRDTDENGTPFVTSHRNAAIARLEEKARLDQPGGEARLDQVLDDADAKYGQAHVSWGNLPELRPVTPDEQPTSNLDESLELYVGPMSLPKLKDGDKGNIEPIISSKITPGDIAHYPLLHLVKYKKSA